MPRGRIAVVVLLALANVLFAFVNLMTDGGDCRTDRMCAVRDVVALVAVFGAPVALVAARVAWWRLSRRSSARAAWPLNGAVAFSVLLLASFPLYATFRDGPRALTAAGREDLHREAARRIAEVVDGTVAALPGAPVPTVATSPGTRDTNDTGTCEHVTYLVRLQRDVGDQAAVFEGIEQRWRAAGMDVRRWDSFEPHLNADDGWLRFYASRRVADRTGRTLEIGGAGPCLRT